ncbi:MAG: hypothetical protein EB079_01715 [Verrucomicrobia bacterium]|nr:hypothetical protein [Verrucomicrobiota bacterium]
MTPYNQEELDRIAKAKETNDKLEEFFNEKRLEWNKQINFFLNKRSRETTKIKRLRQDKFIFYATGFGIKTNLGEKGILIDGHLAENDRILELIESYIEFLRDTTKNLESLGYSIKNMIELMNYLGR